MCIKTFDVVFLDENDGIIKKLRIFATNQSQALAKAARLLKYDQVNKVATSNATLFKG